MFSPLIHGQNRNSFIPTNGYIYNGFMITSIGFTPPGWLIPSESDFITLYTTLGGSSVAGGKLKQEGFDLWDPPNTGATNESNFNGAGSGYRSGTVGAVEFIGFKDLGQLMSSTVVEISGELRYLPYNLRTENTTFTQGSFVRRQTGSSVRFLKLTSTDPGSITDYEGNVYPTVKIGDQVWTAQNWKSMYGFDGTIITNITDDTAWGNTASLARCAFDNDQDNV